jgi:hypothetical protein
MEEWNDDCTDRDPAPTVSAKFGAVGLTGALAGFLRRG